MTLLYSKVTAIRNVEYAQKHQAHSFSIQKVITTYLLVERNGDISILREQSQQEKTNKLWHNKQQ
jgi:hypothetical protein